MTVNDVNDHGVILAWEACILQAKKDILHQRTYTKKGKRIPSAIQDVKNALILLDNLGGHSVAMKLLRERDEDEYGKAEY